MLNWFPHFNSIQHTIQLDQHPETHFLFCFCSIYSLSFIKNHVVILYSRPTDVLLKSKVVLCFYSLHTGSTCKFNEFSTESRPSLRLWMSWRIRQTKSTNSTSVSTLKQCIFTHWSRCPPAGSTRWRTSQILTCFIVVGEQGLPIGHREQRLRPFIGVCKQCFPWLS